MITLSAARLWFAATALVVLVGLGVQVVSTAQLDTGYFSSDLSRVANVFCFFTVWSNLLVMATSALLAVRVARLPTLFWVLRLAAVLCIAVTFVVFHVALSDLQDLEGLASLADFLLHTASPVMCVLGWLVFGPRQRTGWDVVARSTLFPLAWLAFALLRGPLVGGYYAYPFIDVGDLGYPRVLLNCAVVGLLFLALASGAHLLDQRLPRR